jgi:hypothetical protein
MGYIITNQVGGWSQLFYIPFGHDIGIQEVTSGLGYVLPNPAPILRYSDWKFLKAKFVEYLLS